MSNPEIEKLVDQMESGYPPKRVEAKKTLLAMGPKAVSPLVEIVHASGFYEQSVDSVAFIGSCGVILALAAVFMLRVAGAISDKTFALIGFSAAAVLLLYIRLGGPSIYSGLGRFNAKVNRLKKRTVNAREVLLAIDDIRYTEAFCETLSIENPVYVVPVIQATVLTKLLSRIQATDGALFPPAARKILSRFLSIENALQYADFLVAILGALEQVGDESDLRFVQGLATGVATSTNGIRVRTAARQCLATLQEQAELAKAGKMLLRPSEAPDERNNLLRPATGHAGEEEHLLLRSSDSVPEELNLENRS